MMEDMRQRKLQAVYNAIDENNYKSAVKLCQRKDVASWDVTKALLCFCYVRLGKRDEASILARQVIERKPIHPSILVPLRHALKSLRLEEDLVRMYEFALQADGTNLDHAHELFGCYCRMGNVKKMQALAQSLYRAADNAQYLFWAVTSMLLQENMPPMVLKLTEKMIHKVIYETEIDSSRRHGKHMQPGAEELHLYVDILCRQGKWEDALTALDELRSRRPSGDTKPEHNEKSKSSKSSTGIEDEAEFTHNPSKVALFELTAQTLRQKILSQLGRRSDADAQLRSILKIFPDQWEAFILIIESALERSDEGRDAAPLVTLQTELRDMHKAKPWLRSPLLAEMVLLQRFAKTAGTNALPLGWAQSEAPEDFLSGVDRSVPDELSVLLTGYVLQFGTKACCFSDVKPLLEAIWSAGSIGTPCLKALRTWTMTRAALLRTKLTDQCTADGVASASKDEALPNRETYMNLICGTCKAHQIAHFCTTLLGSCGTATPVPGAPEYHHLLDLFNESLPLGVHGVGGDREVKPCDELMLLLSAMHRRATPGTDVRGNLMWAVMLQSAMNLSEHNYSFPLEALGPLRELAAGHACHTVYNRLGVKHIQECGNFSEARDTSFTILRYHASAEVDTGDMISHSFKFHNYMKSLELNEFKRKCQNSITLHLANVEHPLLESIHTEVLSDVDTLHQFLLSYATGLLAPPSPRRPEYPDNAEGKATYMAGLSDNADYELLVRCDALTEDLEQAAGRRCEDATTRVDIARTLLDISYAFTSGKVDVAAGYVATLRTAIDGEVARVRTRRAKSSLSAPNGENEAAFGKDQWDQQTIHVNEKLQEAVMASFVGILEVLIDVWHEGTRNGEEEITALLTPLEPLADSSCARVEEGTLLSPKWVRAVVLLTRTMAMVLPVCLKCFAKQCPRLAEAGKKKPKKKTDTTAETLSLSERENAVAGAAAKVRDFFKRIEDILSGEAERLNGEGGSTTVYVPYMASLLEKLDYAVPNYADSAGVKASVTVAKEVAYSHYISCKQVGTVLSRRLEMLDEVAAAGCR